MKRKITKQSWFNIGDEKKALYFNDGNFCYYDNERKLIKLSEVEMDRLKDKYIDKSFIDYKKNSYLIIKREYIFDLRENIKNKRYNKNNLNDLKDKMNQYIMLNKIAFEIVLFENKIKYNIKGKITKQEKNKKIVLLKDTIEFGLKNNINDFNSIQQEILDNDLAKKLFKYIKRNYKVVYEKQYKKAVKNIHVNFSEELIDIIRNVNIYNIYSDINPEISSIVSQLDRTINSSINTSFKPRVLSSDETVFFNTAINLYRLNELYKVKNNDELKIKVIKDHYYNNVTKNWDNNLDEGTRKCLKRIRIFFRNRALVFDGKDNKNKEFLDKFNSSDEFVGRYTKLLYKYLYNNVNYAYLNDLSTRNLNSMEKQLLKAKNTLNQKLAQNISNVQYTLAHSFSNDVKIVNIINNDFLSESSLNGLDEKIELILKGLEYEKKSVFPKLDYIDLFLISRIRNKTHHYQGFYNSKFFKDNKKILNLEDNYNEIDIYLLEREVEYINEKLNSNNIKSYFEEKDLIINDKSIFCYNHIQQLPKFDKVYKRFMSLLIDDYDFKCDKEDMIAHRYYFQLIYNTAFGASIESNFNEMYKKIDSQYEHTDNGCFNIYECIINDISVLKDFYDSYKNLGDKLTYSIFSNLIKQGSTTKTIDNANKRVVDLLTMMFINFLIDCDVIKFDDYVISFKSTKFSNQLTVNDHDKDNYNIGSSKISHNKFNVEFNLELLPYYSFISLAKLLRPNQLNSMINDLSKYIQVVESKGYADEMKLFDDLIYKNITHEREINYLKQVIIVAKRFVALEYNSEIVKDNKPNSKNFVSCLLDYYGKNKTVFIKDLDYIISANNDDSTENQKYNIINNNSEEGNSLILNKFVLWLKNYGDNENYKKIHKKVYFNKEELRRKIIEFGIYKSHYGETSESNIATIQNEYKLLFENLKKINNKKDFEAFDRALFIEKAYKIKEFQAVDNMLKLTCYKDAVKLSEELVARLVSIFYKFEYKLHLIYKDKIGETILNESILQKVNNNLKNNTNNTYKKTLEILNIFTNKDDKSNINYFKNLLELRNAINHYKQIRTKTNQDKIYDASIFGLYFTTYHLLGPIDPKYRIDIKKIFYNVFENNNITVNVDKLFDIEKSLSINAIESCNKLCLTNLLKKVEDKNILIATALMPREINYWFNEKNERYSTSNVPEGVEYTIKIKLIHDIYCDYLTRFMFEKRGEY